MDGSRFDAWTRRRFGLAASGVAALAVLGGVPGAAAKKKRCKKLGDSCSPNGKRKCCHHRRCGHPLLTEDNHCCRPGGEPCTLETQEECCTNFCLNNECFCKGSGQVCDSDAQCCSNSCSPVDDHRECD